MEACVEADRARDGPLVSTLPSYHQDIGFKIFRRPDDRNGRFYQRYEYRRHYMITQQPSFPGGA